MNEKRPVDFNQFDPVDSELMPIEVPFARNPEERVPLPPGARTSIFDELVRQVPGFVSVSANLESGTNPCRVALDSHDWGRPTLKILSSPGLLFEVNETKLMEVLDIRLVGAPEKEGVIDAYGKILFATPIETTDLYEFLVRLNQWSNAWITIFGRFEPPRTSLNARDR